MSKAHLFEIVEGWGAEIGPFTLRRDAAPGTLGEPFDLPEIVDLILVGTDGVAIVTADWVRVADDQSTTGKGQVYFTPDPSAADGFRTAKSPYTMRWRVPGAPDQAPVYVPSGEADTVIVYAP